MDTLTSNLGAAYLLKIAGDISEYDLEEYTDCLLKLAEDNRIKRVNEESDFLENAITGGGIGVGFGALRANSLAKEEADEAERIFGKDFLKRLREHRIYKALGREEYVSRKFLKHLPKKALSWGLIGSALGAAYNGHKTRASRQS